MFQKIPKWIKISGPIFLFIFTVLLILHFILNSSKLQKWAISHVNQYLGIHVQWNNFNFNAATGKFEGQGLVAEFPQANAKISLDHFELLFNPWKLIIKKIHLFDIHASKLNLELTTQPEKSAPKQKNPSHHLSALLDMFDMDHADIEEISIHLPQEKTIHIQHLNLQAQTPFLFYKKAMAIQISELNYESPKIDIFLDQLKAHGSFDISFNKKLNHYEPRLDGNMIIKDLLLGISKTPTPWNDAPGWDETLTPLLNKKYNGHIPEDNSYAFFDEITLPFYLGKNQALIKEAQIKAFEGDLRLHGEWNLKNYKAKLSLYNAASMKMRYLPLGKAKLRHSSFDKFKITFKTEGLLENLTSGDLKGQLSVELLENLNVSEVSNLTLAVTPEFKNGKLTLPNLKIIVGQGFVNGKGVINLTDQSFTSSLSGNEIDVQTIIRLFSTIDIPGKASLEGEINGALNNPHFNLKIKSPGFSYESLYAGQFDGHLQVKDHTLSLTGNTSLEGKGTGKLDLLIHEIFRSSKQVVELHTDFKNMPLNKVFKTEVIQGVLDGYFNLKKHQANYEGQGDINVSNMTWYGVPVNRISGSLLMNEKRTLAVRSVNIVFDEATKTIQLPQSLVFHFNTHGYEFNGPVLPGLDLDGYFNTATPDSLHLLFKAQNVSLTFLDPIIPFHVTEFSTTGQFDVIYPFDSPLDMQIESRISQASFKAEEKEVSLTNTTQIALKNQKLQFNQSSFKLGQGQLRLNGNLGFKEGSNLQIKGQLDCEQMQAIHPLLIEGTGIIDTDITWQGSLFKPQFYGKIQLHNNSFLFQNLKAEISEANGNLTLNGNRVLFSNSKSLYDEAPLQLEGWVEWNPEAQLVAADLNIKGQELPINKTDSWRVLTDMDVTLKGHSLPLRLSGSLFIVDGLYYKDYSLSQFILKPIGVRHREEKPWSDSLGATQLDLNVKTAGEFNVKNNLVELLLNTDVIVKGTLQEPQIGGVTNVLEGEIHALGIDFEDATGFVAFEQGAKPNPFIEFKASYQIRDYEISAKIQGYADNLSLHLESTPALSQNDIISLIAYGQTPDELSQNKRNLFSRAALASQVVGVLQRPLSKATRLDIVRIETDYDKDVSSFSRFAIGKSLSDRFSLTLTADLQVDVASQGIGIEYLLMDNLLLKGSKDTGSRYRLDLTWRLEAY